MFFWSVISIHALREEGDHRGSDSIFLRSHISIHALREEGDLLTNTLPDNTGYFYPRPPRGGRQEVKQAARLSFEISIHALREEGDREMMARFNDTFRFLSTPSARRATQTAKTMRQEIKAFLSTPSARRATRKSLRDSSRRQISIHALCEEGDYVQRLRCPWTLYFYPRPLRGGRRVFFFKNSLHLGISIHALCEEGDRHGHKPRRLYPISIHALCEEGDIWSGLSWRCWQNFYPRPLRGGRRNATHKPHIRAYISIHALCEEGDPLSFWLAKLSRIFLSTPSARRATCAHPGNGHRRPISIHALCEEGDSRFLRIWQRAGISIHALCEEGDRFPCRLDRFPS